MAANTENAEEEPGKGIRTWGSTTRSTAADGPAVKMVRLSICRVGGSQMAFRVAGMRQALALDTTPLPASVTEFAEHLQAEAEQLMLATPTATSTVSQLRAQRLRLT